MDGCSSTNHAGRTNHCSDESPAVHDGAIGKRDTLFADIGAETVTRGYSARSRSSHAGREDATQRRAMTTIGGGWRGNLASRLREVLSES